MLTDELELNSSRLGREAIRNPAKPSFLITIDTEGDNLWSQPKQITTCNAQFLPRFQRLCESFAFKPTYLTNYEMALCPIFQEFGRDVVGRKVGEIGMHLHAWNSPPFVPLTENDFRCQPYLIEYPPSVMWEKITVLTDILEETFSQKMVSHRAGRWSFNETYAGFLVQKGYRVDCSVNPLVSYAQQMGDPQGLGGTDYTHFSAQGYFLHPGDISRPGNSSLLEVPMTNLIMRQRMFSRIPDKIKSFPFINKILNRAFPLLKFRPTGDNKSGLLHIVNCCVREERLFLEFMLHSSEFMPGGSPTFPTDYAIEQLYDDLQEVFSVICQWFAGATLSEFHDAFVAASSR